MSEWLGVWLWNLHNASGKQVAAFQPAMSKTVNGNSASPHCYPLGGGESVPVDKR